MYDRGHGPSDPSEQTVELLVTAGRAVDSLLAELTGARPLSPLQHAVLRTLADLGPHARVDLAARLETPPADVSRVIDELQDQDLVRAMVVNVGGQHEVVTLTEAGAAARAATLGDLQSVQDVLLASITKGERAQLHHLLRRVCATAARAGHAQGRA
ncbi:MarR family winged helix-turn-helix transcriptional regulator [Streptomyces sp. NPDC090077]|uniref:MarR family winged helix-turn-helix transcriptional regulator n=1 Tax=Streptomyces sp. NPDC090077 TaxID=3365938 RepID=UPI0038219D99